MSEFEGRGRPESTLTSQEVPTGHQEGDGDNQHTALVQGFRKLIRDYAQKHGPAVGPERIPLTPEMIIHLHLDTQARRADTFGSYTPPPSERAIGTFYKPIARAWDVLAYDRYEPGSATETTVGAVLWGQYRETQEASIKLHHPRQIQILDALTEAVGIPHQKGQYEIPLPEKIKDIIGYHLSPEYEHKVAQARKRKNER